MNGHFRNIILIGMAGAGKSTIGALLALQTGYTFIDTDDLIVRAEDRPIQEILDRRGPESFSRLEEQILLDLDLTGHVIATGGSAVYSHTGMMHLKEIGVLVLLEAGLPALQERVDNQDSRGLVNPGGSSFSDLYRQRYPLYRKYADLTVSSSGRSKQAVCQEILARLTLP